MGDGVPRKQVTVICHLSLITIKLTIKRLKPNEIRHIKTRGTQYASTKERHGMLQIAALAGVGRHARAPLPDAFPPTGRLRRRHGIPVSRPHLEGIVRADGKSGGRLGGKQGSRNTKCVLARQGPCLPVTRTEYLKNTGNRQIVQHFRKNEHYGRFKENVMENHHQRRCGCPLGNCHGIGSNVMHGNVR